MQQESPTILYARPPLWAVDKPSGMRVHPADPGEDAPDLCAWLAGQPDLPAGLAPVHRLDLETSGIVLCAATREDRAMISGWFAEGEVKKTYLALVHGRTHKKGIIRRALADGRRGRPLEAVTRYKLEEWLGAFSLLSVRPETGRRHQIRRHLHSIGHPVVGDDLYRPARFRPVPAFPGRLWLHAWRVILPDGRRIKSPLPPNLYACLEALQPEEE